MPEDLGNGKKPYIAGLSISSENQSTMKDDTEKKADKTSPVNMRSSSRVRGLGAASKGAQPWPCIKVGLYRGPRGPAWLLARIIGSSVDLCRKNATSFAICPTCAVKFARLSVFCWVKFAICWICAVKFARLAVFCWVEFAISWTFAVKFASQGGATLPPGEWEKIMAVLYTSAWPMS